MFLSQEKQIHNNRYCKDFSVQGWNRTRKEGSSRGEQTDFYTRNQLEINRNHKENIRSQEISLFPLAIDEKSKVVQSDLNQLEKCIEIKI